jgi:hypothetical protein
MLLVTENTVNMLSLFDSSKAVIGRLANSLEKTEIYTK